MTTLLTIIITFAVLFVALRVLRRDIDPMLAQLFSEALDGEKASMRFVGLLMALFFGLWCWATFDLTFPPPAPDMPNIRGIAADTPIVPQWVLVGVWLLAAWGFLASFVCGVICAMTPSKDSVEVMSKISKALRMPPPR